MPISPIVLQRRHAELGRIRLGQKNPDRGFPMKLSSFRFTSPSQPYINDLAELYGGTPHAWDNAGKPEFEVFTTATSLPVYVVKGGLSQWMETWVGGGIAHRCDGERQADGTTCDPDEWIEVKEKGKPKRLYVHRDAKPTTRLSVMLPELEAIGVWRMESHGWNAAAEIPAVAELAQYVGDLVPAVLNLIERRTIKDGQTSRFVVPVLDLRIGQARLREVVAAVSGGGLELAGPAAGAAAIEASAEQAVPGEMPIAVVHRQPVIPSPEQVAAMDAETATKAIAYLEQHGAGEHPATAAVRARLAALVPDADGVVDGVVVEDPPTAPAEEPNPEQVWQQIVTHAGTLGWTLDKVRTDFTDSMGMDPGEASGFELTAYYAQMTTGEPVSA